jgi:nucleoside-diphosphate-sugar epimerase|tara:strand:+ start:147 stop:1004 length:858 start_codon:yes stop_codon:yes gene_type:complete
MNILLTGATGFVGSNILAQLIFCCHNITIVKRINSDTSRINQFKNKISIINDINDIKDSVKFDCVIHAATSYEKNEYGGSEILLANINLPVNLLDFVMRSNCKKFINLSTFIAQYQSDPPNKYALTKRHFEEWGAYYANYYSLSFINLVLHQVYGVGDSTNKFIPWLLKQIKSDVHSVDLTKGYQERDFINVKDVATAVSLIVDQDADKNYENYEICTGKVTTIRKFAETIKVLANSNTKLNFGSKDYRENEIMTLNPSSSKLKKLGWDTSMSLEHGIKQMLDNY